LKRRLVTKESRREIPNLFGHREHVLHNKQWFGAVGSHCSTLGSRQDRYPSTYGPPPLTSVLIVSPSLCVTHTPTFALRNRLVHFHLTRRRLCIATAVRTGELGKNVSSRVRIVLRKQTVPSNPGVYYSSTVPYTTRRPPNRSQQSCRVSISCSSPCFRSFLSSRPSPVDGDWRHKMSVGRPHVHQTTTTTTSLSFRKAAVALTALHGRTLKVWVSCRGRDHVLSGNCLQTGRRSVTGSVVLVCDCYNIISTIRRRSYLYDRDRCPVHVFYTHRTIFFFITSDDNGSMASARVVRARRSWNFAPARPVWCVSQSVWFASLLRRSTRECPPPGRPRYSRVQWPPVNVACARYVNSKLIL